MCTSSGNIRKILIDIKKTHTIFTKKGLYMFYQIIILFILILFNAYFAAAEIAYISINESKINKMSKEGNKRAKQIEEMLKNPSKFLATIQIGVTLAGFLSSAFASDAFANQLAYGLNRLFSNIDFELLKGFSIVFITIILSFFTLVFGELVPKRLAMKYYEKIAFATISQVKIISKITAPFVKLLTYSTNMVSRIFGVKESEKEIVTEEEIKMLIDEGQEKGAIEKEEKELLNNVFEFNDIIVSEIMTPRTDIFAIEINDDISKMLNEIDEYKYSRIPIYEETIDNIQGVLFVKDILKVLKDGKKLEARNIMRTPYFVPESKEIDKLFRELQKSKQQMAIVIDEYGGTAGLVTMEDIIEELMGNIFDEYDEEEIDYKKIDENTYLVSGNASLYEIKKIMGVEIPEGDYETLSGFLLEKLGRIPNENEDIVIEDGKLTFKIEDFEDKRIKYVKICKNM